MFKIFHEWFYHKKTFKPCKVHCGCACRGYKIWCVHTYLIPREKFIEQFKVYDYMSGSTSV